MVLNSFFDKVQCNETWSSTRSNKIVGQPSDLLLSKKKDCAPWKQISKLSDFRLLKYGRAVCG